MIGCHISLICDLVTPLPPPDGIPFFLLFFPTLFPFSFEPMIYLLVQANHLVTFFQEKNMTKSPYSNNKKNLDWSVLSL